MKISPIRLIIILVVIVVGAIFFNKYLVKNINIYYPKIFINFGSYLFTKAENLGGLVQKIENFNHLASDNEKLQQGQKEILSLKAKLDSLEGENDFLRRAVGVSQRLDHSVIYAGIFNLNLAPTGYNVLLNKGAQDGISEGDVVITAEGILVGKIQKVMQNFSRVMFISDSEFKITAKVLSPERSREGPQRASTSYGISSSTTGIARGALIEGMYLDFVVQDDEIKEGDMLISTGNDMFPPALVIGLIDRVESNTAQMFKNVNIRPAVKDIKLGRVLILKMK